MKILFGITNDGDGVQLPGGYVPPPMGPEGVVLAANASQMAHKVANALGATLLRRQALRVLTQLVECERTLQE